MPAIGLSPYSKRSVSVQLQQGSRRAGSGQSSGKPVPRSVMARADANFEKTRSRAMARHYEVTARERAKQMAGRHLAGSIRLQYNTITQKMPDGTYRSVTYATGGNVPIHMPGVPQKTPQTPAEQALLENRLQDLEIARDAAAAANDASSQDMALFRKALSGMNTIDQLMAKAGSTPLPPENSPKHLDPTLMNRFRLSELA